jgi:hypothetical protein
MGELYTVPAGSGLRRLSVPFEFLMRRRYRDVERRKMRAEELT